MHHPVGVLPSVEACSAWRIASVGAAHLVSTPAHCATGDRPIYDRTGKLLVVTRPWRGDLYRVDL